MFEGRAMTRKTQQQHTHILKKRRMWVEKLDCHRYGICERVPNKQTKKIKMRSAKGNYFFFFLTKN